MRDVMDIALSFYEGLNCARALTAAMLLRYEEHDQLVRLAANPLDYADADAYAEAAAATDFLRKFDGFPLSVDLEREAIEKWFANEALCLKTNLRMQPYLDRVALPGEHLDERILSFLDRVREKLRSLLGERPPSTWEGAFGPGATVSDSSRLSTVPDKLSSVPTLTPNALFHLVPWTGTKWAEASAALGRGPLVVRGNSFFTVPKTSVSRRACAKEPSLNGFYQLGLGRVMKRRLASAGFDLYEGQDVHRRVACAASKSGLMSTIDLSSASDTVATSVVKLLLPPAWHATLDSLRSPFTVIDGKTVRLEKFSSMGNGFTFELETAIFAAIALACVPDGTPGGATRVTPEACSKGNVFVYGDDIIVPRDAARDVLGALRWFGFIPNPEKTFIEGVFKESCGGDYYEGKSVRPIYLKADPDEPQKLIALANQIRSLMERLEEPHRLLRCWFGVLDRIPSNIRSCRGPKDLGDICIHDESDRWVTRVRDSIRRIRVYKPASYRKVRWNGFAYDVQWAAALYGIFLQEPNGWDRASDDARYLIPREGVEGYAIGYVPYS